MPCTARSLLLGVERVGAVEQLGVGAQAGERGAQLVARVGDELLLLALRHGERVDHRREARGQAADLAAAGLGDRRVEVLGPGDALGGVAQALDRADEPAGEAASRAARRRRSPTRLEREQLEPQRREDVLVLLERPRRSAARAPSATATVSTRYCVPSTVTVRSRGSPHACGRPIVEPSTGSVGPPSMHVVTRAVGGDELRGRRRLQDARRRAAAGDDRRRRRVGRAGRRPGRSGPSTAAAPAEQRLVDAVLELVAAVVR